MTLDKSEFSEIVCGYVGEVGSSSMGSESHQQQGKRHQQQRTPAAEMRPKLTKTSSAVCTVHFDATMTPSIPSLTDTSNPNVISTPIQFETAEQMTRKLEFLDRYDIMIWDVFSQQKAAKHLSISESTLKRRLKRFKLSWPKKSQRDKTLARIRRLNEKLHSIVRDAEQEEREIIPSPAATASNRKTTASNLWWSSTTTTGEMPPFRFSTRCRSEQHEPSSQAASSGRKTHSSHRDQSSAGAHLSGSHPSSSTSPVYATLSFGPQYFPVSSSFFATPGDERVRNQERVSFANQSYNKSSRTNNDSAAAITPVSATNSTPAPRRNSVSSSSNSSSSHNNNNNKNANTKNTSTDTNSMIDQPFSPDAPSPMQSFLPHQWRGNSSDQNIFPSLASPPPIQPTFGPSLPFSNFSSSDTLQQLHKNLQQQQQLRMQQQSLQQRILQQSTTGLDNNSNSSSQQTSPSQLYSPLHNRSQQQQHLFPSPLLLNQSGSSTKKSYLKCHESLLRAKFSLLSFMKQRQQQAMSPNAVSTPLAITLASVSDAVDGTDSNGNSNSSSNAIPSQQQQQGAQKPPGSNNSLTSTISNNPPSFEFLGDISLLTYGIPEMIQTRPQVLLNDQGQIIACNKQFVSATGIPYEKFRNGVLLHNFLIPNAEGETAAVTIEELEDLIQRVVNVTTLLTLQFVISFHVEGKGIVCVEVYIEKCDRNFWAILFLENDNSPSPGCIIVNETILFPKQSVKQNGSSTSVCPKLSSLQDLKEHSQNQLFLVEALRQLVSCINSTAAPGPERK